MMGQMSWCGAGWLLWLLFIVLLVVGVVTGRRMPSALGRRTRDHPPWESSRNVSPGETSMRKSSRGCGRRCAPEHALAQHPAESHGTREWRALFGRWKVQSRLRAGRLGVVGGDRPSQTRTGVGLDRSGVSPSDDAGLTRRGRSNLNGVATDRWQGP